MRGGETQMPSASRQPSLLHRSSRVIAFALLACAGPHAPMGDKGRLTPVAGLSLSEAEEAVRPRKIALVIGIDQFDDPFWPDLRFAVKDARDLTRTLSDPRVGAFDDVVVL